MFTTNVLGCWTPAGAPLRTPHNPRSRYLKSKSGQSRNRVAESLKTAIKLHIYPVVDDTY